MQTIVKWMANVNIMIGIVLMLIPFAFVAIINTPEVWYRLNPNAVEDEIRALTRDPFAETLTTTFIPSAFRVEAPIDPSLPKKNKVTISKIGVDTVILEGKDERAILEQGVWRMPNYGTPTSNDQPIILAAHRWGPTYISPAYRNKHMFINLPKLRVGDKITITWEQRKYVYEIKSKEVNTYVSQLADLILVTCQYYDSPERILVYADRIV